MASEDEAPKTATALNADDEPIETPEQSAAIVDANLRGMGARGLDAVPPVPVAAQPPRATTCGRCHPAERCSCQDSPAPVAVEPECQDIYPGEPVTGGAPLCPKGCGIPIWRHAAEAPVPVAARVTATAIRQALYDSLSPNFEIDSDTYDDAAVAVALLLEPQPRWGSGPLVDRNPEAPGTADLKPLALDAGICRCGADGHGPGDNRCVCRKPDPDGGQR